ncbi:UDP-3-O-(3-hydroxymyristoyl)glucosamine N-acyltransferase [Candidatus Puniceispirillum sp.]|nr:UDP-3-O-(3-hydroxymyristoyl)glucosamine N-acyltransferase [Candidatus Puniceispirillum sp.]
MTINPAFYKIVDGVTANDLAIEIGAKLVKGPKNNVIKDIVSFDKIASAALVFQSVSKMLLGLDVENAIIITDKTGAACVNRLNSCLMVDVPRIGFARALEYLVQRPNFDYNQLSLTPPTAIAKDAVIHPSATIMENVFIGPGTLVDSGAVLHPSVQVGKNCHIGSNSVLSHCVLGDYVEIGSGTVIGDSGFGFEMTEGGAIRMKHLGLVQIEDSTIIGSACAIDRGSLGDTRIGAHVMIDNLCHIAHNVTIGAKSIISGQCGISGSVTIGTKVSIGGQVGIAPHVNIGDGAVLTARSGVTKNIGSGEHVAGFPAISSRQFWRNQALIRRSGKT